MAGSVSRKQDCPPRKGRDVAWPGPVREVRSETAGIRSTAVRGVRFFGLARDIEPLTPDIAPYLMPVVSLLASRTWTRSRRRDPSDPRKERPADRSAGQFSKF